MAESNAFFSFVVLIILNALKKLTQETAVRLSQTILNFAAFSSVRSSAARKMQRKRGNFSWKQLDFYLVQLYGT